MPKKRIKEPMPTDAAHAIGLFSSLPPREVGKLGFDKYAVDANFRAEIDEQNLRRHETTGDPLVAWYAYFLARKTKQTVPEWVMKYLDGVAIGLLDTKNKLSDCALHLGFELKDGGSTPFKRSYESSIRKLVEAEVKRLLAVNPEKTVDNACEEGAQWLFDRWGKHVDAETVKKWYYKPVKI